ncbi:MAG: glycosyl hydrolase family 28 protein [Acidobacteriaceae bacterium]|nr:glycosyl hydrolase family 28 protein [Acidobacteriaceae bacterium]
MRRFAVVLGVMGLAFAPAMYAQDTRTVTEPVIPAACVTLDAQIVGAAGNIAAADEAKLDTARIQKALDSCGKGKAVELAAKGANNAFLSGPLQLRTGVTLLIDKGVTLFGSRDAEQFATSRGSCGVVNEAGKGGCRPLIAVSDVKDAAIMGDGVIDGRGGRKILGKDKSWWELAEDARTHGHQQCFRLIVASHADRFTLYRITLKNSPNFHMVYNAGDGFTVWGLKIDTPKRGARNTDGVDPGNGSKNITITQSFIRTGDDNVAIKGGTGGVTNMTVSHNHFYWGHGMSIGSETNGGVSKIRVTDLSLDGPDNGIRIKSNASRGGLVHDVVYDDVCVRDSPNPITLDTSYSAAGSLEGKLFPEYRDVTLHNVRVSGGGKISFNGYSHEYRAGVNLDTVVLTDYDNVAAYKYSINHADIKLGPGPVNLKVEGGADSTVTGNAGEGVVAGCKEKFVPFPLL